MVGALLLAFTGITVALSYSSFWNAKGKHCRGNARRHVEGWAGGRNFHASRRRKTADLSHLDFHRLFCARDVLAYFICVVRFPIFR